MESLIQQSTYGEQFFVADRHQKTKHRELLILRAGKTQRAASNAPNQFGDLAAKTKHRQAGESLAASTKHRHRFDFADMAQVPAVSRFVDRFQLQLLDQNQYQRSHTNPKLGGHRSSLEVLADATSESKSFVDRRQNAWVSEHRSAMSP